MKKNHCKTLGNTVAKGRIMIHILTLKNEDQHKKKDHRG